MVQNVNFFDNHFHWLFTSLVKQFLPAGMSNSCAYKTVDKQVIDYYDDNLFENDEGYFF